MVLDVQKLFNEELPAALAKHPDQAKQIGAKYQINIMGEGGGSWFIDASDSGPSTEEGDPGGADCSISITVGDFQKLHENPQVEGVRLFFEGAIKVTGNQLLATKLQKLFSIG